MKDEKKVSWSKGQIVLTSSIFIFNLGFVYYMYLSGRIETVLDTALLVSCVTVSGAIFGSNLVWYSKKAASENHYKLRMSLYENSSKVRLEYNEKMMKLMRQYNMSQEELEIINSTGDMDEMMDSALSSTISGLDTDMEDADSPNEMQSFDTI